MKLLAVIISAIMVSTGCVSSAVKYYGLVEVFKYPEGREPAPDSEYAPVKTNQDIPDEYKDLGAIKVSYAHYTGYIKEQIKEEAYKKMYEICDKKYEIVESKQLSERVYQASYSERYTHGTGGGSGSAGDVLLTGEIIAFRCID